MGARSITILLVCLISLLGCVTRAHAGLSDIGGTHGTAASGTFGDVGGSHGTTEAGVFGDVGTPIIESTIIGTLEIEDCAVVTGTPSETTDGEGTWIKQSGATELYVECAFDVLAGQEGEYRLDARVNGNNVDGDSLFVIAGPVGSTPAPADPTNKYNYRNYNDTWNTEQVRQSGPPAADPYILSADVAGAYVLRVRWREAGSKVNWFRFEAVTPVTADRTFNCDLTADTAGIKAEYELLTAGQTLAVIGNCDMGSMLVLDDPNRTVDATGATWTYSGNYADDFVVHITGDGTTLKNVRVDGDDEICGGIHVDNADDVALTDLISENFWQAAKRGSGRAGCYNGTHASNGVHAIFLKDGARPTLTRVTAQNARAVYNDYTVSINDASPPAKGIEARVVDGIQMFDVWIRHIYSGVDGDCLRLAAGYGASYANSISVSRQAKWEGGGAQDCTERGAKIEASGFHMIGLAFSETFIERRYTRDHSGPGEICEPPTDPEARAPCINNYPTSPGGSTWVMFRDCDGCELRDTTAVVSPWHWQFAAIERDGLNILWQNIDITFAAIPGCTTLANCGGDGAAAFVGAYGFGYDDETCTDCVVDGMTIRASEPSFLGRGSPEYGFRLNLGNGNWDIDDLCVQSGFYASGSHTGTLTNVNVTTGMSVVESMTGSIGEVASCP